MPSGFALLTLAAAVGLGYLAYHEHGRTTVAEVDLGRTRGEAQTCTETLQGTKTHSEEADKQLPLAVKKSGLVVTMWVPKGTSVDWGDTGTTAAVAADGDVSHTYAAAGTYQVVTANLLSNGVGKAAVTV